MIICVTFHFIFFSILLSTDTQFFLIQGYLPFGKDLLLLFTGFSGFNNILLGEGMNLIFESYH